MRPRRGEGYCCASAVDGNAGIAILQAMHFEVAQAAQLDAAFGSIGLAGSLPPLNET